MKLNRFAQFALIAGIAIFLAAASANASVIYNTNPGSAFGGGGLILNSTAGGATLVFSGTGPTTVTDPTNVNLGVFELTCAGCATGGTANFPGFTFNLIVTDTTNGTFTKTFLGSSAGGVIGAAQSGITIVWTPLTQNIGTDFWQIYSPTPIVAPNTGSAKGSTTVQGFVTGVPEPVSFILLGSGLLALGLLRRRKS
jgi:hypothetical protein